MRRVREEDHRGSQDQGAARLRSFGLDWNRSQLAKAERGERPFTVEQVVLIAAAYDVKIAVLLELEPGERVQLTEHAIVDDRYMRAVLKGESTSSLCGLPHLDCPQTRHWYDHAQEANERFRQLFERVPTDAEKRLAHSLDTKVDLVNAIGVELWKRTFLEEREARVERELEGKRDASVSALRGHATRALIAELRPIVAEWIQEER